MDRRRELKEKRIILFEEVPCSPRKGASNLACFSSPPLARAIGTGVRLSALGEREARGKGPVYKCILSFHGSSRRFLEIYASSPRYSVHTDFLQGDLLVSTKPPPLNLFHKAFFYIPFLALFLGHFLGGYAQLSGGVTIHLVFPVILLNGS